VEDLDGDLDWYQEILAQGWYATVDACARDSGYASGYSDFSEIPARVGDDWLEHDQSTLEDRARCADNAMSYPGLDAEVRDDLLGRTRQRLQSAVETWIRGNPSVAVPVEWHPGAPQPFADSLVEMCQLSSDPAQCARDAGVVPQRNKIKGGRNSHAANWHRHGRISGSARGSVVDHSRIVRGRRRELVGCSP